MAGPTILPLAEIEASSEDFMRRWSNIGISPICFLDDAVDFAPDDEYRTLAIRLRGAVAAILRENARSADDV